MRELQRKLLAFELFGFLIGSWNLNHVKNGDKLLQKKQTNQELNHRDKICLSSMDPEQTFLRVHARVSGMLSQLLNPRIRTALEYIYLIVAVVLFSVLVVMHTNFVQQVGSVSYWNCFSVSILWSIMNCGGNGNDYDCWFFVVIITITVLSIGS